MLKLNLKPLKEYTSIINEDLHHLRGFHKGMTYLHSYGYNLLNYNFIPILVFDLIFYVIFAIRLGDLLLCNAHDL